MALMVTTLKNIVNKQCSAYNVQIDVNRDSDYLLSAT